NATTSRSIHWGPSQTRGLVQIGITTDQAYTTIPSYIQVIGLDLRNAVSPNTLTDSNGQAQTYTDNAASLFIERGQHIVVRGCTITGSGNGLFVSSSDDIVSRDVL